MSEKAARPAKDSQAGAKLESLYKPVGIAAVNAVALCLKGTSTVATGK